MLVVLFELIAKNGKKETYLDFASALRKSLSGIDGFIDVERFQSLTQPEKLLSISFWENESSIEAWRTFEPHRAAQNEGKDSIFQHYRLTVATIVRQYSYNAD